MPESTLAIAARKVLEAADSPLRTAEILRRAVAEHGLPANTPVHSMRARLGKDVQFKRVADGLFELAERRAPAAVQPKPAALPDEPEAAPTEEDVINAVNALAEQLVNRTDSPVLQLNADGMVVVKADEEEPEITEISAGHLDAEDVQELLEIANGNISRGAAAYSEMLADADGPDGEY